jgi:hypothetical protein
MTWSAPIGTYCALLGLLCVLLFDARGLSILRQPNGINDLAQGVAKDVTKGSSMCAQGVPGGQLERARDTGTVPGFRGVHGGFCGPDLIRYPLRFFPRTFQGSLLESSYDTCRLPVIYQQGALEGTCSGSPEERL